jgi:5'-nucleotidase/UDP-sugar diphosphatase
MIESIRKDKRSVLLLDSGAVFGPQNDNAELQLKAMERMGYDALNLGIPELHFGKAFLERTHSQVSFPYVASNLLYNGGRLPWIREYVIKEVGGIKAAILGILDPDDFKKIPSRDDVKGFEVIPPEAALKRLLPEVRGKADLVILLSQLGELGEIRTLALVGAVGGIDVAIFSERNYLIKPPEKNVIVLQTATNGTTMGLATITLDDKGARSVSKRRDVPLDGSVPDNGEIVGLVETYKKEQEIKKEKMKKELMKGLQLTPEAFMERYRKQQTEQKKGEAQ